MKLVQCVGNQNIMEEINTGSASNNAPILLQNLLL